MTEDDAEAFMRHLTVLAETFGEPMTAPRHHGYFLALRDLPLDAVRQAIETAMQTCRFFPRPVELRELSGDVAPDVGLIEACLVAHLRAHVGYYNAMPADPFLRIICERLGGPYAMGEMTSFERLTALKAIVPGVVAAARARGIELPHFAAPQEIAMAGRETHAVRDAAIPIPHERAADVLRQITTPDRQRIAALIAPRPEPVEMSEAQIAERKAVLREQAERILLDGDPKGNA